MEKVLKVRSSFTIHEEEFALFLTNSFKIKMIDHFHEMYGHVGTFTFNKNISEKSYLKIEWYKVGSNMWQISKR